MGSIKSPELVQLFVGLLATTPERLGQAQGILEGRFGPVAFASLPTPWEYSRYYAEELGNPLLRQFLFFRRSIRPERLASIKSKTNEIEGQMGVIEEGRLRRSVNLDPGYLCDSKIVLATTKDYSHRIYLGEGIFGEVTLIYQGRGFQPLAHTYPDYGSKTYLELFNQARAVSRGTARIIE